MRGMGEYFSGVGAAPLEVPPALRARVARRNYYNHCIATHRPTPDMPSKCAAKTAEWARQHRMAGLGEYFSGVGLTPEESAAAVAETRGDRFLQWGFLAAVGLGGGAMLFHSKHPVAWAGAGVGVAAAAVYLFKVTA